MNYKVIDYIRNDIIGQEAFYKNRVFRMRPVVTPHNTRFVGIHCSSPACTAPSVVDHSPRGVLNTHIKVINDRDTQTVHATSSSALQSRYDHEYATTRRDPVYDFLYGLQREGATIQSVMIINQTIIGKIAFVGMDYFWHYSGRVQTDERCQIMEFVNEGGEWKLNNFFPFDEPDSTAYQK